MKIKALAASIMLLSASAYSALPGQILMENDLVKTPAGQSAGRAFFSVASNETETLIATTGFRPTGIKIAKGEFGIQCSTGEFLGMQKSFYGITIAPNSKIDASTASVRLSINGKNNTSSKFTVSSSNILTTASFIERDGLTDFDARIVNTLNEAGNDKVTVKAVINQITYTFVFDQFETRFKELNSACKAHGINLERKLVVSQ